MMFDDIWKQLVTEAIETADREPGVASLITTRILSHGTMADCVKSAVDLLLEHGSIKGFNRVEWVLNDEIFLHKVVEPACSDLAAHDARDPASGGILAPFLFYKGFHALVLHRVAHVLWLNDLRYTARAVHSVAANQLSVDIHPAARLGVGLMIDHGTGVVIGETAVIDNEVSIMQGVTLGGTGKDFGDRHPKIGRGVLLGAGSSVLGNINVGEGVKIAAGSVVLEDVPPHVTVAGIPARITGRPRDPYPGTTMNQFLDESSDSTGLHSV